MDAQLVTTLGLNALSAILILSLAALGLAIIFGFMGVINLAHGAYVALGAYTVWFAQSTLGIGFWGGFILAPVFVAVVGFLTEAFVVKHLYHRLGDTILATWGISIVIGEVIKLLFGATSKQVANPLPARVDLGVTTYPVYRLFLIGISIVLLFTIYWLFQRTNYGIRLRAVIQDETAASLLGVNRDRVYKLSYSIGAALAGIAGAGLAPIVSVNPDMGVTYLTQSFLAIILGGGGNLLGVVPGSIVIAGISNTLTFSISPVAAQTLVYILAIAIIVARPEGFFGGEFNEE
ncbi:MAG: branched-chain amino acid ABC transporter permease [Halapricum sp.]